MTGVLNQATLAAYLLGSLLAVAFVLWQKRRLARLGQALLWLGLLLHTLALAAAWLQAGAPPVASLRQSLAIFAWALMATGLIVNLRPGVLILGALLGPLACLLLLAAAVLPRPATPLPELMGSLWVIGHVAAIYAGYGLFTLNFLAGALYLVQDAQIRGKSLGPVFKRLPPLGRLEALGQRALYAGFALFTLGLVAGAVYAQLALGSYWRWDPKEVWSLVTWLLYAALLHTRLAQGWRGRRGAWLGALAFAALVFTYLGAGLLLSGYHSFDELRQLKGARP